MYRYRNKVFNQATPAELELSELMLSCVFPQRQDMIGVVSQLIRPSSDQLLVKVHLDEMDSFVFALATKKTAARLSKEMTDIVSVHNKNTRIHEVIFHSLLTVDCDCVD